MKRPQVQRPRSFSIYNEILILLILSTIIIFSKISVGCINISM
nr:MAG TPA: hypothetical protein [Caudoviricetes sp.]